MTLSEYLQLLDWTGRQVRRDGKLGRTPPNVRSVLDRVGVSADLWVDCVKRFRKWHSSGVGRPASVKRHAERSGRNRSLNTTLSKAVFA